MKTKSHQFTAILSALILFYLAEPYFMWAGFIGTIYTRTVLAFIMGICFYSNRKKLNGYERFLYLILIGTIVIYPIIGGYNFNFLLSILPVVLIPFSKEEYCKEVFRHFLTIFAAVAAVGLFFWLLAQLGAIGPMRVIPPLNPLKSYDYYVYPFFVSATDAGLTRFNGVFDEPGLMGTLCGIMLCIEKMKLKSWKTIVLLLSGLTSLSLFFYLIIAVYYIIYLAFEKKNVLGTSLLVIVIVGFFFLIPRVPVLQEYIGDRLEWNSDKGSLAGDNRANNDLVYYYLAGAVSSNQIWFGIENKDAYMADTEGSSSFLSVIVLYGVVFSLLYIVFFMMYASYYRKDWVSFVLFMLVFIGVMYQRPNLFHFVYVFLFSFLARTGRVDYQLTSATR